MTELLGKRISYKVANGEIRKGTIIGYEHHVGLNKEIFNCVSPYGNRFRLSRGEFKLVEDCFVCEIEDKSKFDRGTMSHPIDCKWRMYRERGGYKLALEKILEIYQRPGIEFDIENMKEICNIAVEGLMGRYDIKNKEVIS